MLHARDNVIVIVIPSEGYNYSVLSYDMVLAYGM